MHRIKTHGITKRFGAVPAAVNISIKIDGGEIYGFLGLNGAGKTTLIRMLLGMIRPDSGETFLFGVRLTRRFDRWNDIGYLVETPQSYPNLTVRENLDLVCRLRGLSGRRFADEVIERFKLISYRDTKARVLSLGNRQRLGLAKALLHRPALLILDEPVNGLDPEGIVEVRELLQDLARNGTTVFLSSHILGEISRLAHRIGIINRGRIIKELNTGELSGRLLRKLIVRTADSAFALRILGKAGFAGTVNSAGEIEITQSDVVERPEQIASLLVGAGLSLRHLSVETEDLESFFMRTIRGEES